MNSAIDGANMILFAFDTLLGMDEDLNVVPALAESWEESEDGMTWTFHLRDGLKWSDGSDLTAEDFVYSWQRMADPATAAPYAETVLGMVKNFSEISKEEKDPSELGVSAPDAQTFVVELGQPCTYFDKIASFVASSPVQQESVEANGDAWAVDPSTYVSSGAFMMTEWVPGSHITSVSYTHLDVYKRQALLLLLLLPLRTPLLWLLPWLLLRLLLWRARTLLRLLLLRLRTLLPLTLPLWTLLPWRASLLLNNFSVFA